MKNVFVTGADGFVGKYVLDALRGTHVVTATRLRDDGLSSDATDHVITLDITDVDATRAVIQTTNPAWIIHLAGFSSVAESFKQPELTHRINVDGTKSVLEAARSLPTKPRVLVIGSSDEYGIVDSDPITEETSLAPKSPYAKSKVAAEQLSLSEYADMAICTRSFPHTGPGQSPQFVTADFAQQIARIESGQQEPVILVGNTTVKRDLSDVRDVVRAYLLLLEKGKIGEVYNVCSSRAEKISEVLRQLLNLSAIPITVEQDPAKIRPVDLPVLVGDNRKLKQATGWQPEIPLAQTLKDVLDYWRGQTDRTDALSPPPQRSH